MEKNGIGFPVKTLNPVNRCDGALTGRTLNDHFDASSGKQRNVVRGSVEQGEDALVDKREISNQGVPVGVKRSRRLKRGGSRNFAGLAGDQLGELVDSTPITDHEMVDHLLHGPRGRRGPCAGDAWRDGPNQSLEIAVCARHPRLDIGERSLGPTSTSVGESSLLFWTEVHFTSGPLISLARIGQLELLPTLFGEVLLPRVVR
jgi:hypothetical protein